MLQKFREAERDVIFDEYDKKKGLMVTGVVQRYEKPNVPAAVAAYRALARELGMTPARMALAFVYRRWFVASTIIGATTMAQLRENLDAWDEVLTEAAVARIEALHLRHFNPAP